MARYKIDCCFQCEDRQPGCHGSCEEYKKQRAEMDETKAAIMKRYEVKVNLDGCLFDSIHRSTKRVNYRNKYRRKR